jgi:hypothetical protein
MPSRPTSGPAFTGGATCRMPKRRRSQRRGRSAVDGAAMRQESGPGRF